MSAPLAVALLALAPGAGPELVVQAGHASEVVSLAFSADGRHLASAAEQQDLGEEARRAGEVKLWDLESGKLSRTLPLDGDTVRIAAGVVAVRSRHTLHLFDAASGQQLPAPRGSRDCAAFDATPAGRLAIADDAGTVVLEQAADGKVTGRIAIRLNGAPRSLALSRDGRRIAIATDGNVFIADARSGVARAVQGGADQVVALALARDGSLVAGVGWHGDVTVWEIPSGRVRARVELGAVSEERTPIDFHGMSLISGMERTVRASVAFSPDGKRLAAANRGNARVWALGTRSELASIEERGCAPEERCVSSIAWSPDGGQLASGGRGDGTIHLTDARRFTPLSDLGVHALAVSQLIASPVAPLIALATSDGSVKAWDAATGRELRVFDGLGAPVVAAAFGAGGRLIAGASRSRVDVWEVATGEWAATLTWSQGATRTVPIAPGVTVRKRDARLVTALAVAPDGRSCAVMRAADLEPADVAIFDLSTQRLSRTLATETPGGQAGSSIAFSPDGNLLAAAAGSEVLLWRPETGERVSRIDFAARVLAFSRDGRRLALGGRGGVKVVGVPGGAVVATLRTDDVSGLDFGAGDQLAIAAMDGSVVLADVGTGANAARTRGHGASALGVAFLADGRRLASIGGDLETRFWDPASGALLATLAVVGPSEFVVAAPDGHYLASPAASAGIAFRLGARAFPFEQFDLPLNRPDVVLDALGYAPPALSAAYRAAHERRAARMGLAAAEGDLSLPSVEFARPPLLVTRDASVKLPLAARASGPPLVALDVTVNGVPVLGRRGVAISGRRASTTVDVPLAAGPNQIAVSARDARGLSSLRRTVRVVREGAAAAPRLFVLAVGVSRYRNRGHDLHFADRDAMDIAAALRLADGLRAEEPRLLLNEQATRDAILGSRAYLTGSRPDDVVVVSLSGHGFLDAQGRYLFASTDADLDARNGGVRYDEIEDLLDGVAAQRKLVLIDTCQSGESDDGAAPAAGGITAGAKGVKPLAGASRLDAAREVMRDLFADLRVGTGATVIAAAGGSEYALEMADLKNGVFTHAIIEGLSGRARPDPRDGRVHVSGLRDFTIERVSVLTRGRQVPMSRRENVALDFALPALAPR